jgi:transposase
VGNTLAELAEFLGQLEPEPMLVSLESTTNSRAMQRLLQSYGQQAGIELAAQVLDARKLRIIAESVSKCDRLDAAVLNELSRSNLKLPICYMPDDEVFALREHLRGRADLVQIRTMLKNRVHALLHRRGILRPAQLDLFTAAGQQYLAELALDEAGAALLERYRATLEQLDRVIGQSTASLRQLGRQERWRQPLTLLQSMPGIGLITGLTILAELGEIQRFASRAAVSNYAGLVPVVRESNAKRYRGPITGRGPAPLRQVLVEAAWVAVGKVPAYAALFGRVAQRQGKAVAIVAVARRMVEEAWLMLKRGESFRYMPVRPEAVPQGQASEVNPSVAG